MNFQEAKKEATKFLMNATPKDFKLGSSDRDYKRSSALKSRLANGKELGVNAVSKIMKLKGYEIIFKKITT